MHVRVLMCEYHSFVLLYSGHTSSGHTSMASLSSTSRPVGVTMTTMDTMMGDAPFPLTSATVKLEAGLEKKPPVVDHFSEKAVKISTALDQIFDSDGEEDSQPVCSVFFNCYFY